MGDSSHPLHGRVLAAGTAAGQALVLDEPLSLWGGMDPVSGEVIDRHHPQQGESLAGRVVIMPAGRGSSSSSSVLAEAARAGRAPAAILLAEPDLILAIGASVAQELYDRAIPIIVLAKEDLAAIEDGSAVVVEGDGTVRVD
jgi:predicted aconitase with swiveling domain